MKVNRLFLVGITLLLFLMFWAYLETPKKFSWVESFSPEDKNPFGCYVFDSLMRQTLPNGYETTDKTLYELNHDGSKRRRSILFVAEGFDISQIDVKQYLALAEKGNQVMIVASGGNLYEKIRGEVADTVSFLNMDEQFFNVENIRENLKSNYIFTNDTIFWIGDRKHFQKENYIFFDELSNSVVYLSKKGKNDQVLAVNEEWKTDYTKANKPTELVEDPLFVKRKIGKGCVFYSSTPLLLTNYGILDGAINGYVMRQMSQIANLPVVRMYHGEKNAPEEESPFLEILKRAPLKWAFYLSLLGCLLFMFFTARRRQRVIPVVQPPMNKSLEFVQMIGTLYHQQNDNLDLVQKKFTYFVEEIRRRTGINIEDVNGQESAFKKLAKKTGLPESEIENNICDLRVVCNSKYNISNVEMRHNIDIMNGILKEL
jgi:hypothetical protein